MAQNVGILISQPGVSVSQATPSQILMNTSNPFIKLDTQVKTSFQTITLLITTNPPEPVSPATDTYTVVYQFNHGYKYVPSIENLFNITTPPPSTVFMQTYFLDSGQIAGQTVADGAYIYAIADVNNVYFIVHKFKTTGGSSNLLTGTNISITSHVFVESVLP